MHRNPTAMASTGSAAFNGSPPHSPHDRGGHLPVPPVAAEGNGTRADDQPITNPLQPSSSTPSPMRDRFSPDLEAADHHHQQAVWRSPLRGDTLLNLCVPAIIVLIIEIVSPQISSATETLSRAFTISVVFFAFGFTSTWIGMFLKGVNAAAALVMEALGHLFTLFGFFFLMGTYLSQRFGGIIAWPLVVLLFLASASASASSYATFR